MATRAASRDDTLSQIERLSPRAGVDPLVIGSFDEADLVDATKLNAI